MFTYPGLTEFQQQYTGPLHSWAYVHAMEAISNSGLPGSVLSLSGGATLHWTFAMTDRNVYSPTIVSGFVFKQSRVIDDQLAYFPFHSWTAVSNGVEYVSVPGNTSEFFYGAPVLGALRFGTPTPILEFPPDGFVVTLANGSAVPAYSPGGPIPSITVVNGSVPSIVIRYVTSDFVLTVTSTTSTGGVTYVNSTATATGSAGLKSLASQIRQVQGVTIRPKLAAPNASSFVWNVGLTPYRSVIASGAVAPPGTVALRNAFSLDLARTSTNIFNGSPALSLSVSFQVPGANSLGSTLPALLDSAAILQNWNVRFVLLNNITRATERATEVFLEQEFGATPYFGEGQWEVLLLPENLP